MKTIVVTPSTHRKLTVCSAVLSPPGEGALTMARTVEILVNRALEFHGIDGEPFEESEVSTTENKS